MKRFNKIGSMQLSINAIVVIVLALTMLGLGLSFIKGQVQKMSDTSIGVQEQIAEQIEGQLRSSGEKMSFPREMTLARSEAKVITLGVQNTQNNELYYKIFIELDCLNTDQALQDEFSGSTSCSSSTGGGTQLVPVDTTTVRYDRSCLSLGLSDATTHGIQIKAPKTAGTAALRARIAYYESTGGDQMPAACRSDTTGAQGIEYASKLTFLRIA